MTAPHRPAQLRDFFDRSESFRDHALVGLPGTCSFPHLGFDPSDEVYGLYEDGTDIWERLVEGEYLSAEEGAEFAERYHPILVDDEIEDWGLPFNALVVDTQTEKLPVLLIGYHTGGALKPIASALSVFEAQNLLAPGALDPKELVSTALEEAKALSDAGSYEKLLELASRVLQETAFLAEQDDGQDNALRRRIGGLHNGRGIALKELGRDGAAEAFAEGMNLGDANARLNLIELYCYRMGEYQKARELSRFYSTNDSVWFFKVKVDAYASMMLGDTEQAETCYRKLQDAYMHTEPERIRTVREELEGAGETGAPYLAWFGVAPELSADDERELRSWWDGLELNWQKQFRVMLSKAFGVDARAQASNSTEELSTGALVAITEAATVRLYSDYPVSTLAPLHRLANLRTLNAAYAKLECIGELSTLPKLSRIDLSGNDLENTDALEGLSALTWLDISDCESLTASLATLTALEHLNLGDEERSSEELAYLEPLVNLRELELAVEDELTDVAFLSSLTRLEELEIEGSDLSDLSALASCTKLRELTLKSDALVDIEPLGRLTNLEELALRRADDLEDIGPLANCTNLKDVDLSFTSVRDVRPLLSCVALKELDIYVQHKRRIQGAEELMGLPSLKKLTASKGSFPRKLALALEEKHPGILDLS